MMLTDTILRNRYKILKELGRGGFSVTYLAVDMDLPGNPKCVVKQLKTRNNDRTILQIAKKLFNREAQVLYRLGKGHKQIPEMFAHFEENDEFYLVQEFVDGHDLTKEVKPRHRLSEEKVIKLLQEILEILVFVHENNVIHRDIKLRNIMRRREDGKIVLIDFGAVKEIKGLAKNQQGDVNSTLVIGTPGYMPDEQANGKPRLCSDVYAVGMLGIQAVTGISPRELPFNPDTGELIWLNSAKISDKLAEVLTGMVRHHFSQRYQTAAEALKALKSPVPLAPNAYKVTEAPPITLPYNYRRSHPPIFQSLGLVGLIGIGIGLGVVGLNLFQSSFNGNEPALSEVKDTIIKNINPSTTPTNSNNSNPTIFLPSTPKVGSKRKPIFSPFFIPFFNENKIQVTQESPKSKTNKKNQALPQVDYRRKPIPKQNQPSPKTSKVEKENPNSNPYKSTPKSPINQESLPSTSITPSPSQEVDNSPTSLPDLVDKQKISKDKNKDQPLSTPQTSLPDLPDLPDVVDQPKISEDKDQPLSTSQTSLPDLPDVVDKPKISEDKDKDKDKDKDQPLSTPQTSLTPTPDVVDKPKISEDKDKDKDQPLSTPQTSLTPTPDVVDKPKISEDKDKDKPLSTPQTSLTPKPDVVDKPKISEDKDKATNSEEQPNQTPTKDFTPAIENHSPSPIPTPEPIPTTGSVIVPTTKPQETPPVEESNNYFIAIPTEITPIPEAEIKPLFSPQPIPTPESKIEPTASPEAEIEPIPQASALASPEAEIKLTPQPSPTASPEAEIKLTPQPSPTASPEAEIEPTPQPSSSASPEAKIEPNPQPSSSASPEAEIEPNPQASVPPLPESKIEPTPQASAPASPEANIEPNPQPSSSASPEAEIEPNPQASIPPLPESKIEPNPQPSSSASPEAEIEPNPQASVPASPESRIEPKPIPTTVKESGLSLEHFNL